MSDRTGKAKRIGLALGIATVCLLCDQIIKEWLIALMQQRSEEPMMLTSFFNLVMVWNHGVSFGMLSEPGTDVRYFLMGVALVIVTIMSIWLYHATSRLVAGAIGLIIGGAIGNVIDRIRFGAVADFFDFHLYGVHWPAFNIADASIFVGVALLICDSIVSRPPSESKSLNS